MSNNNYERKYCLKSMKIAYKLFETLTPHQLSKKLNISEDVLNKIYEDNECVETVSHATAKRISDYIDVLMCDAFEEVNEVTTMPFDRSFYTLAEEVIMGLKNNIVVRLESQRHTQVYIQEIIDVVDNIIIESAYLGRELTKDKKDDKIIMAIAKRRNNK